MKLAIITCALIISSIVRADTKDDLISCLKENSSLKDQLSHHPEIWACAYTAARITVGFGSTREEAFNDAVSRAGIAEGGDAGDSECSIVPSQYFGH